VPPQLQSGEPAPFALADLHTAREDQLSEELWCCRKSTGGPKYILKELSGTQFKVMRLYQRIPGIALRVGLDALQILEKSPAVTNVVPDRPSSASR
jgi:hypothetical protein